MQSMLDTIGSVIIGGIVLLTIMSALFRIQGDTFDATMQLSINKTAEDAVAILENYYLKSVGTGIHPDSISIISATTTEFVYLKQTQATSVNPDTVRIYTGANTRVGFPFRVEINSVVDFGPFMLEDSLKIEYYNQTEGEIVTTADSLDFIRSAMFDMTFFYPNFDPNKMIRTRHRIIFWKYFKNLYF